MPIYATKPEGNDFAKVEPGTYMARCYSMVELGHIDTEFNGEKKKAHKVMLTWELPEEMAVFNEDKGPEPYSVSKTYTLSMHEKSTLRKDLESWRGKGFTELEAAKFDITKLLGWPEAAEPRFNTETCFEVEVAPQAEVSLDRSEHSEYRWCSLEEALDLAKWEGAKAALRLLRERLGA